MNRLVDFMLETISTCEATFELSEFRYSTKADTPPPVKVERLKSHRQCGIEYAALAFLVHKHPDIQADHIERMRRAAAWVKQQDKTVPDEVILKDLEQAGLERAKTLLRPDGGADYPKILAAYDEVGTCDALYQLSPIPRVDGLAEAAKLQAAGQ